MYICFAGSEFYPFFLPKKKRKKGYSSESVDDDDGDGGGCGVDGGSVGDGYRGNSRVMVVLPGGGYGS